MKKKNIHLTPGASRYLLIIPLALGLSIISPQHAKAQQPPVQGNPPPPPPSPAEVLDKINPFKKKNKAKAPESAPKNDQDKKAEPASPAGGLPAPPPNPLDLFKKKKADPVKPTTPSR